MTDSPSTPDESAQELPAHAQTTREPTAKTPFMHKLYGMVLSWKALGFAAAVGGGFFAGRYVMERYMHPAPLEDGPRVALTLRGDEPSHGAQDALVTVVEFSDFECPYCVKAAGPLLEAAEEFPKDVRVLFKHYPLSFHTHARPAAMAAWAAHQQGKFWQMHDYLFSHEAKVEGARAYIESIGGDGEKFAQDAISEAAEAAITADMKAGNAAGFRGTPAFWINGHMYGGAMGSHQFVQILEHELKAARELEQSGTPRVQVLEALLAKDKSASASSPSTPASKSAPLAP